MLLLFLISLPFIIAQILILWFETDFLIEYVRLFRLNKIGIFKTFDEQGGSSNFKEFLTNNYNSFPVHLITCPVCFSTALSLIINVIMSITVNWLLGIILWLPIAYGSLFLYEKMKKLLRS